MCIDTHTHTPNWVRNPVKTTLSSGLGPSNNPLCEPGRNTGLLSCSWHANLEFRIIEVCSEAPENCVHLIRFSPKPLTLLYLLPESVCEWLRNCDGKGRNEKFRSDCKLESDALWQPCSVNEMELGPCFIPMAWGCHQVHIIHANGLFGLIVLFQVPGGIYLGWETEQARHRQGPWWLVCADFLPRGFGRFRDQER